MKQPGTDLFLLIGAMTQAEKRYFKVTASPYGKNQKNKYLKLFDRIEKQKVYDEKSIKNYFRLDPFLGKHLKKAKLHLYKLILSTLEKFDHDENSSIQRELHQHRILFRKGLYEQSKKILVRTKNSAKRYENFPALLEACELERHLISVNREFTGKEVKELPGELKDYMEKLKNIHAVWELQAKVFGLFSKNNPKQTAARRQLALTGKKIFKKQPTPLSNRAGITLYNTLGTYYMQLGLYEKAQQNYLRALVHYANPKDETSVLTHAQISSNYISACLGAKQYAKVSGEVNRLLLLTEQYPNNKRLKQVQCYLSHTGMSVYISSGNFHAGIEFAERVKNNYFSGAILRDKILFSFNSAVLSFGIKNYRQALFHTHALLNIPETSNPLPKTIYWCKIIQLLVCYEMKDFELLGYKVKSANNYFQKRNQLQSFEKTFLDFLKKYFTKDSTALTGSKLKLVFMELRKTLFPVIKKSALSDAYEYFDFLSWIESKIQNVSFEEIVRRRKW